MTKMIQRYPARTRLNHWAVALMFVCAGLSGLSIFHPALFFLSNLFGGGPWTRILHPFFGVLMVAGFLGLFFKMWRDNLWRDGDGAWVRHSPYLLKGDEVDMPPVGKYNAGQKLLFWVSGLCLVMLLVTGIAFWQPWFADFFPVPVRRVAVLLHATSAVALIMSIFVHIYAAIWVKGSIHAMVRGSVSVEWARRHHLLWFLEIDGKK
jgi:formate dehydrogenase subunit gamma